MKNNTISKSKMSNYLERKISPEEVEILKKYCGGIKFDIREDVNIYCVYSPNDVVRLGLLPSYVVFFKEDNILIYDTKEKNWHRRQSVMNYLCYDSVVYFNEATISLKDAINTYTLKKNTKKDELKKLQLTRIETVMEQVPKLPKSFSDWLFQQPKVILLDKTPKLVSACKTSSKLKGYCTCCQSEVGPFFLETDLYERHTITCPKCKKEVKMKLKREKYYFYATIIQKMKNKQDLVKRDFQYVIKFNKDTQKVDMEYTEIYRHIIFPNGTCKVYQRLYSDTNVWTEKIEHRSISSLGARYSRGALLGFDYNVYTKNLKAVVKNTAWEYSAVLEYIKSQDNQLTAVELLFYLVSYPKRPILEALTKIGCTNIIQHIDYKPFYDWLFKAYNMYERYPYWDKPKYTFYSDVAPTNIYEVLGIKKSWLLIVRQLNLTGEKLHDFKEFMETISYLNAKNEKIYPTVSVEDIKLFLSESRYTRILHIRYIKEKCLQPKKIFHYLRKQSKKGITGVIQLWYDYLYSGEKVYTYLSATNDKIKPFDFFPKELQKEHDRITKLHSEIRDEMTEILFKKVVENWDKFKYAGENYSVVPPTSSTDLILEGKALNHCVGSYISRVAHEKSIVLFVRNNDVLDTPFCTLELSPLDYHIIQLHSRYNTKPSQEVFDFVDEWLENFKRMN